MSAKKSAVKKPKPEAPPEQTPASEEQPTRETPPQPAASTPEPETPATNTISLEQLQEELELLKQLLGEHTNLITQLQEALARKRKPVASNGKVQIKDKLTGKIYKSKNNTYKSLLKSGDLKDLVDQGIFGDIPEKNTFGWYVLNRACPDRFEEVHEQEQTA